GGRTLFLDRRGDRGRDRVDLADRLADGLDRRDRGAGRLLDAADLAADLVGRPRRLRGEALHLRGNDGEAFAGFAGARGFDRRVQRQQVGLAGNVVDQAHDLADLVGGLGQAFDLRIGALRIADGAAGHLRRLLHLAADLRDRGGELLGRRG